MFNNQPDWTHWDTLGTVYYVTVFIGFVLIMFTEKDRVVKAFVKRPFWNLLTFAIFTPAWFWMVLAVRGDDDA